MGDAGRLRSFLENSASTAVDAPSRGHFVSLDGGSPAPNRRERCDKAGILMRSAFFIGIMFTIANTTAHGQSLHDQEICAKQAKYFFEEFNTDDQKISNGGGSDYLS